MYIHIKTKKLIFVVAVGYLQQREREREIGYSGRPGEADAEIKVLSNLELPKVVS